MAGLGLEQKMYKLSEEPLVTPESKEVIEHSWVISKDSGANLKTFY